jgi:inorganic triphosphatase YgiF
MDLSDREEVELKLAVVGASPHQLFAEIERLEELDGRRLTPPERHRIHDLYWDTPSRDLGHRHLTLRLRDIDGQPMFTAKGSSRSTQGLFRREEMELPANRESWAAVSLALRARGARLHESDLTGTDPASWLEAAGLSITQDRSTERVVRYALMGGERIAELALDAVRYRFGAESRDYFEVEIEQLGGGEASTHALGNALMTLFPGRLRPASMGKYSHGLRLQRELGKRRR